MSISKIEGRKEADPRLLIHRITKSLHGVALRISENDLQLKERVEKELAPFASEEYNSDKIVKAVTALGGFPEEILGIFTNHFTSHFDPRVRAAIDKVLYPQGEGLGAGSE